MPFATAVSRFCRTVWIDPKYWVEGAGIALQRGGLGLDWAELQGNA
ncbi:hypothetical protein [Sulfitobacter sp. MF3-043]